MLVVSLICHLSVYALYIIHCTFSHHREKVNHLVVLCTLLCSNRVYICVFNHTLYFLRHVEEISLIKPGKTHTLTHYLCTMSNKEESHSGEETVT